MKKNNMLIKKKPRFYNKISNAIRLKLQIMVYNDINKLDNGREKKYV